MTHAIAAPENTVATGLGWPEGPTVLPDGRIVLVESYRSQLTAIDPASGRAERFAYVAGAPNSCVLGSDGAMYVCQNGGTTGPWRAAEMTTPHSQFRHVIFGRLDALSLTRRPLNNRYFVSASTIVSAASLGQGFMSREEPPPRQWAQLDSAHLPCAFR